MPRPDGGRVLVAHRWSIRTGARHGERGVSAFFCSTHRERTTPHLAGTRERATHRTRVRLPGTFRARKQSEVTAGLAERGPQRTVRQRLGLPTEMTRAPLGGAPGAGTAPVGDDGAGTRAKRAPPSRRRAESADIRRHPVDVLFFSFFRHGPFLAAQGTGRAFRREKREKRAGKRVVTRGETGRPFNQRPAWKSRARRAVLSPHQPRRGPPGRA